MLRVSRFCRSQRYCHRCCMVVTLCTIMTCVFSPVIVRITVISVRRSTFLLVSCCGVCPFRCPCYSSLMRRPVVVKCETPIRLRDAPNRSYDEFFSTIHGRVRWTPYGNSLPPTKRVRSVGEGGCSDLSRKTFVTGAPRQRACIVFFFDVVRRDGRGERRALCVGEGGEGLAQGCL